MRRFAVRNSGGNAVTEGCGSNGCEYMTGGNVVILGNVGDNFGAGMTGGIAFIYDPDDKFENFVNPASLIWQEVETKFWQDKLKGMIEEFIKNTGSEKAKKIFQNFERELSNFKQVCPIEMLDKLENPITMKAKTIKSA